MELDNVLWSISKSNSHFKRFESCLFVAPDKQISQSGRVSDETLDKINLKQGIRTSFHSLLTCSNDQNRQPNEKKNISVAQIEVCSSSTKLYFRKWCPIFDGSALCLLKNLWISFELHEFWPRNLSNFVFLHWKLENRYNSRYFNFQNSLLSFNYLSKLSKKLGKNFFESSSFN